MPAKTYQYSGKFDWDIYTKLITKNGQFILGQDTRAIRQNGWRNCRDKKQRYFSRHNYSWNQIDQLVYQLYEFTEEEIKIIEGN